MLRIFAFWRIKHSVLMTNKTMKPGDLPRKKISRLEFLKTVVGTAACGGAVTADVLARNAAAPAPKAGERERPKEPIFDKLEAAERYYDRHPAFAKAFAFLRSSSLANLAPGKHEIEGDRLFCLISKSPGRKRSEAKLEAHRKYIDIQYIIAGADQIGWKPTAACASPETAYDPAKDIIFFKDPPRKWAKVSAGSFAIFFPRDAHAPLVSEGEIHKAVMKVAVTSG